MARRRAPLAALELLEGIAGVDGDKLQDARVTIAIDHASCAAVANKFGIIELVNAAHGCFPKMAAVKVQIPIEVKVLMPAQAPEFLRLTAQMALHFGQRLLRIDDREAARPLQVFHPFEYLDQFVRSIAHQL